MNLELGETRPSHPIDDDDNNVKDDNDGDGDDDDNNGLTKSFGDGDALEDGDEWDDDDGGAKLGEHSTKGNDLILKNHLILDQKVLGAQKLNCIWLG